MKRSIDDDLHGLNSENAKPCLLYTYHAADDLCDAALGVLEVPMWQRFAIYRSVRCFGGRYWDDNTAEKVQGLKRVIVRFPDDPKISWAEWRARPDVFKV